MSNALANLSNYTYVLRLRIRSRKTYNVTLIDVYLNSYFW